MAEGGCCAEAKRAAGRRGTFGGIETRADSSEKTVMGRASVVAAAAGRGGGGARRCCLAAGTAAGAGAGTVAATVSQGRSV